MAAYTTINDPEAYFQVQLYTGNGSANNAITLGGDTDMQPDLVWIKNRDAADAPCVFDSVRGATKVLHPDVTNAEATDADTLDSFTSDGFQVDADEKVNTNAEKYVAWCWKESATAGFDILIYTGTGSAHTISHNLSAVPHLMIHKGRSDAYSWITYHHKNTDAPETDHLTIESTTATADSAYEWNDTAPTSSVWTVGSGSGSNQSTKTYVAYLWTSIQGFSKFGQYEGNGNANGAFVYTGFRPAFVMCKSTDSTSQWYMFDNKREGANVDVDEESSLGNDPLAAEVNTAEATTAMVDLLSNGFKFITASDPNVAETYIYMAFAEAPFANSNGVPCNAR